MLDFLKEFQKNRREVGAVAPSSRFLAQALLQGISDIPAPRCILEVGPGTGAVTRQLVKLIKPGDRLWLVEANPRFCELLRRNANSVWSTQLQGVDFRVHSCYLEKLPAEEKFHAIVSGLPLNSFEPEVVRAILKSFARLLRADGQLSYFEYLAIRKLRRTMSQWKGDRPGCEVDDILNRFISRYQYAETPVLRNLPPAVARHFHKLEEEEVTKL